MPNLINSKEQNHFSTAYNISVADEFFKNNNSDSIKTSISKFYDRNVVTTTLFGTHYRNLWAKEVRIPIFKGLDSLEFHKVGGGNQTTSIEMKAPNYRHYSFRSIDKDQSRVLPKWLSHSALRPLLRDQASALNPYSAPIVAKLSEAINILHTNSTIYVLPYNSKVHDSIKFHLPAAAVIFEEELGSKWKNSPRFLNPVDIINTDEMLAAVQNSNLKLDTLEYLKCRLFDILISDWDRHSGQWKWLIYDTLGQQVIKPFPIDRDMAFCRFDDGWINTIVTSVTNKFKSFRKGEASMKDGADKITDLDILLLKGLKEEMFIKASIEIKTSLSDSIINDAMSYYPPEIYKVAVSDQKSTLKDRIGHLETAAMHFYETIHH